MPAKITKVIACRACGQQLLAGRSGSRERKYCSRSCASRAASSRIAQFGRTPEQLERHRPTEHPTVKDIAWAAGIFEGEGHVNSRKGSSLYVGIGQKEPWLVHRLKALFGGGVIHYRTATSPEYWRWQVNGPRARGFMLTIFEFLSPRRKDQFLKAYLPLTSG